MAIEDAARLAIEESIKEGILVDFLKKHKQEAIMRNILVYDEELDLRLMRMDEREIGRETGWIENQMSTIRKKLQRGKTAEEIADNLEMEIGMVTKMIELIAENPQSDDLELARQLNNVRNRLIL